MISRKKLFKNSIIAVTAFAVISTLGVQTTAALWSDSKTSTALTGFAGAYQGSAEMNGKVLSMTATANTYETKAVTLSQANIDSLVTTGKVAIPLTIKTSISGLAAIQPLLSVTTRNWNNDSTYIEPAWKLHKMAADQTCNYSDVSGPNFVSGVNTLTLNGAGNSNSNPYLVASYNTTTTKDYLFCLTGTAPVVNCETGKTAVYANYANECGTSSNTGTLKFDKLDGTTGEVSVTDTFDKVTQKHDWAAWGEAVDKDTVKNAGETAAISIKLGYKITSLDEVANPDSSSTGVPNMPMLGSTETPEAPSFTTTEIPAATLGVTYTSKLQASGAGIGYIVADGVLPTGMTLKQESGELAGKPKAVGSSSFTIAATNSSGTASRTFAIDVKPVAPLTSVTAGYYHSVSLDQDGRAWAWGRNDVGQIGNGNRINTTEPVEVLGNHKFVQVEAGGYHNLGIDTDGKLWAWGYNTHGQLGVGDEITSGYSSTPVAVKTSLRFKAIALSEAQSFALDTNGKLWAWGYNNQGQLGLGDTNSRDLPTAVKPGYSFTALAAGTGHTVAIDTNGAAWAWGLNSSGQLGDTTTTNRLVPVLVAGGKIFKKVEAGQANTLALDATGKAWGWGNNINGRLGTGTVVNILTPTAIQGGIVFASIESGYQHSTGLDQAGKLWTWGLNTENQLGNTAGTKTAPTLVSGDYVSVGGGAYHTVALDKTGKIWAWGLNSTGQLGTGDLLNASLPTLTRVVS